MKKFVFAAAAAIAVVSCSGQKAGEQAEVTEKVRKVTVYEATVKTVPQNQTYSTTVLPNVTNNIASQSAGRIQKINVEVGDFVSAGQIIAEMDRVQLDQAGLRLKNSRDELARIESLYEEGGVSLSDYEAARLSCDVAESSYKNLEENTILRSPVDGVITARNYDRGDMYAMAQPIYTVQQITPVKLLVGISETDYTKVKKGDKVVISADALPGKEFVGTVIRIYPIIDAASHTFNAEVHVPNTNRALRPGMYARATVHFGDNRSIVVPDAAIQKVQGSGSRFVFVLSDKSTAVIKVVTLGRHIDTEYEILSGLQEGDKVIIKGASSLKSGEKVEVEQ